MPQASDKQVQLDPDTRALLYLDQDEHWADELSDDELVRTIGQLKETGYDPEADIDTGPRLNKAEAEATAHARGEKSDRPNKKKRAS
jgi:hypothetical protein